MTDFLLSPAAQADLEEIWDYTVEHWDIAQAERYVRDIRLACAGLASGTKTSRPVDVRAGYRKCYIGSHVLFFKSDSQGTIIIVRILHKRMDVERHL